MGSYILNDCDNLSFVNDLRKYAAQARSSSNIAREGLNEVNDGFYNVQDTINTAEEANVLDDIDSTNDVLSVGKEYIGDDIYNNVQCMNTITENCAESLYNKLKDAGQYLSDSADKVLEFLGFGNDISDALGTLNNSLLKFKNLLNQLNMGKIFNAFDDLLNCQTESIQNLLEELYDEISGYMDEISEYMDEFNFNDEYNFDAEEFISKKADEYYTDIENKITGIKESIVNNVKSAQEQLTELSEKYKEQAKLALEEQQPEKLKLPVEYI